jgi:hypothetical protein
MVIGINHRSSESAQRNTAGLICISPAASGHLHHHGFRAELAILTEMKLVLADVLAVELFGRAVEVSCSFQSRPGAMDRPANSASGTSPTRIVIPNPVQPKTVSRTQS